MCSFNRWQTRSPLRRTDRTSGFTIVELLLALAILVTLAAMVVPSFTGLLADRRVLRAGDQLRVEFMQARLSAMRSGRTYMVQLSTETHQLRIRPWVDANDMTEALDQTGGSSALLTGGNAMVASMQEVDTASEAREVDLPEGVTITSLNVQSSQRSFMIESQVQAEAAVGWGQPVLFYPDGTTSTAAVTVTSEGVGQVIVLLRGLTGEATVTDVLPVPETAGATG
jgi:prepilin-type N-terminal cleavage/methylation domain-containing protein